jgi:hypothetical protein
MGITTRKTIEARKPTPPTLVSVSCVSRRKIGRDIPAPADDGTKRLDHIPRRQSEVDADMRVSNDRLSIEMGD